MSLVGAALLPAAPVLIAGMAGTMNPAREPRTAALAVLRLLLGTAPQEIVVIAEGDADGTFELTDPWALARFGGLPDATGRPVATGRTTRVEPLTAPLTVGAALLDEVGWRGPTALRSLDRSQPTSAATTLAAEISASTQSVGLVLLGSGSARCTAAAPGSLHPDAGAFNDRILAIVRDGADRGAMGLTREATAEHLSDIRLPLQVLGGVEPAIGPATTIAYSEDFGGVYYLCAMFGGADAGRIGSSERGQG